MEPYFSHTDEVNAQFNVLFTLYKNKVWSNDSHVTVVEGACTTIVEVVEH